MAWYILVGTLAAFGLLCALWTVFGCFLPRGGEGELIFPGREGELNFLRRYLWLRGIGALPCTLVVIDLGLSRAEVYRLEKCGIEIRGREAANFLGEMGAEAN